MLAKNDKAFTLIELLVVIAIIGILSTVVFISISTVRARARDSRRVAELKQIQIALEMYYDSTGDYPTTGSTWYNCSCAGGECANKWSSALQPLVNTGTLPVLPSDPLNRYVDGEYFCYEYLSTDTLTSGMLCDGVARTDYEYVLLFSSETTSFDLPELTNNAKYDYCIVGPLKRDYD